MTISNSMIKTIAKNTLKSNFINSVFATAIMMAVWFICYNISAVFSLIAGNTAFVVVFIALNLFAVSPLVMGLIRFFWRLICGQKDNPISVFYYFSDKQNYIKVLRLGFALAVRIAVCYLVFSIPVYVLKLITGTWLYGVLNVSIPIWTANLTNVINFLQFISFTATAFYSLRYYLAPMLLIADENMDTAEAVHLSAVITKRTTLDFIFLGFSFFGWILLSLLAVPLLFTVPYFAVAYLVHCSYAVEGFNEEIAKINHDDIPTFVAGV